MSREDRVVSPGQKNFSDNLGENGVILRPGNSRFLQRFELLLSEEEVAFCNSMYALGKVVDSSIYTQLFRASILVGGGSVINGAYPV